MESYKIRIDTSSKDAVQKLMDRYAKRYLFVFEKIGTPDQHCHIYMETQHSHRAIRAMIRKVFGSGNGVYSMVVVEHEPLEYLAYCLKEGKPTHNIGEELLTRAREHDKKVKAEIKLKKASRRSQLSLIKEYVGDTDQLFEIARKVVQYYKDRPEQVYRRFYALSVVETIYLQNCEEAESQFANDLYFQIRNR